MIGQGWRKKVGEIARKIEMPYPHLGGIYVTSFLTSCRPRLVEWDSDMYVSMGVGNNVSRVLENLSDIACDLIDRKLHNWIDAIYWNDLSSVFHIHVSFEDGVTFLMMGSKSKVF